MTTGDRVTINHPGLDEPARGVIRGMASTKHANTVLVRLDGTDRLIDVPESMLTVTEHRGLKLLKGEGS